MPFGEQLRRLLDANHISVAELSRRTGINKNTLYSFLRRNTQKVDPDVLRALADFFGEDTFSLLGVPEPEHLRDAVPPPSNRKELFSMPELSRFYNIVIRMMYDDNSQHHKPHFHAYFAEYEASVGVDGELLAGSLPVKQLCMVQAWAAIHEEELYAAWINAVRHQPMDKIDPLR